MMKTFLIIDGNAILHRAYHALPDFQTKNGIHTNAVYGFITMLDKSINNFKPDSLVVCFDSKEKTKRKEMFENYKAQRPKTDENLISQFPLARDFLKSAGILYFEKPGYEADDLIGIIAREASSKDYKVLIMSGDKDLMQLVNDKIFMITPGKSTEEMRLYDRSEVIKKFNIPPELIADFKSLTGDPSDNYKGIDGIGPKTASNLINKFGNLEEIYKNLDKIENPKIKKLLEDYKEDAFLSKKLSTIMYDADIKVDFDKTIFKEYKEDLKNFLEQYQFRSILSRIFKTKKIEEKPKVEEKKDSSQISLF